MYVSPFLRQPNTHGGRYAGAILRRDNATLCFNAIRTIFIEIFGNLLQNYIQKVSCNNQDAIMLAYTRSQANQYRGRGFRNILNLNKAAALTSIK